jgi:putative FmdB family regulatory protein
MPTYEYICRACDHEFEVFQSMKEGPKRKCPECGKSALERKIGTGAAVIFKGSGFYQTDYRSEAYKKSAEAEKKPAADPKPEAGKADAVKADAPKAEAPKKGDDKPSKPAESAPLKEAKPEKKPPRSNGGKRAKS